MTATTADVSAATPRRRTLTTCCAAHALHDGYADMLYLLFPVWQAELALSLTQVGLLRTVYSGAMASFQIPAGLLAERFGERWLLALGTALAGLGLALSSLSVGFVALALCLIAGGLGAAVQHPLSSSLVTRAFDGPRLRAALGTYNFAGDVGKAALPALLALMITAWGWRDAIGTVGLLGIVWGLAIVIALGGGRAASKPAAVAASATVTPTTPRWRAFASLSVIGMLDSGTRTGFLTFLPFLLIEKGVSVAALGIALALVFIGGAVGKFVCGLIARRVGVLRTVIITECATAVGMLGILVLPQWPALALLPLVGIALNGTSSVVYGSVPELVPAEKRVRAFGLFYTVTIGSGALAPVVCGALGDAIGLHAMVPVLALAVLTIVPLTWPLRGALASD
ncbi:MAG: MFS transporter [Alphaproteobacteria bacterium]|nr:MFS transporter [Alphaproteobacteria bacterium]